MTEWFIICKPKDYDIAGAFHDLKKIDWSQNNNIEKEDIVYIYVSNPVGELKYKCIANKVDLKIPDIDDSRYVLTKDGFGTGKRYMELEILDEYDDPKLGRDYLLNNGLGTVRGSSRVTSKLHKYIESCLGFPDMHQVFEKLTEILEGSNHYIRKDNTHHNELIISPLNTNLHEVQIYRRGRKRATINTLKHEDEIKKIINRKPVYYEKFDMKYVFDVSYYELQRAVKEVFSKKKKAIVNKTLQMQIENFNKHVHDEESEQLALVKQFVIDYTVTKLQKLGKEDYVYGLGKDDTFCYRVTHELQQWGSIRNGTPNKFGFYFDPRQKKYLTVSKFGTTDTDKATEAAYYNVKEAIYQLIIDGGNEDYVAIENNQLSKIFKGKLLCIYYPEKYLNIYSERHIKYYMDVLGITYNNSDGYMTWLKQIIDWKNNDSVAINWTNHEFSKFLYHGIGYPPDSEMHKKEVRKQEKKIDDELLAEIDDVPEAELPEEDTYTPAPESRKDPIMNGESYSYPRDKKTALKALKHANYECEIDKEHPSFIRKTNGTNYTEPHHLVPMSEQDNYDVSLDVQANIVSLCSNCHNQLHYGKDSEELLRKLYDARKEELQAASITVNFEELLKLYK